MLPACLGSYSAGEVLSCNFKKMCCIFFKLSWPVFLFGIIVAGQCVKFCLLRQGMGEVVKMFLVTEMFLLFFHLR